MEKELKQKKTLNKKNSNENSSDYSCRCTQDKIFEKEDNDDTLNKNLCNSEHIDNKNCQYSENKECGCLKDKNSNNINKNNDYIDPNDYSQDQFTNIINDLKKNNDQLKTNLIELNQNLVNDRLKYIADLDNFKKRLNKEKETEKKYASLELIKEILLPFEQLEKVVSIETTDDSLKNFLSGFKMVYQQMQKILEKNGVKEIPALGVKFNSEQHCAIDKISDINKPNNTNISVFQKGFFYKDIVIKPALVKINEWSDEDGEKNKNK
ncbi:nucleotide exchange factor GrpE [Candidatus Phytoplasma oryzae]|nr:nucleotide exchange factor GrpE [Candidatus Phytoplasma oryzae]